MADLPESIQWITLKQLSEVTSKDFGALRVRLHRSVEIIRSHETTAHGRELRISVESLLEHGWITTKQIDKLTRRMTSAGDRPGEGETLLMNSAVLKKLQDLSVTEIEILDKYVPTWSALSLNKIVKKLSVITGKHRTWFLRDHRTDKRTQRESILDKITPEQLMLMKRMIISIRMKKNFVDQCMKEDSLPKLSDRTYYRIHTELEKEMHDEIVFMQSGEIALRQQTEPIRRDKTFLGALECVVGDYWRVDCITKWADGTYTRPALAVWVDFRTNLIVGYALAKNPNSLGVKTSLYEVFARYGIPDACYMDNGKEYRAHRIAGLKDEIIECRPFELKNEIDNDVKLFEHAGILPALGIRDMRAIIRNARAKPIERIFGRGGFTDRAKELPGYSGSKYWEMPEVVRHALVAARKGEIYVDKVTGETLEFCDIRQLVANMTEFIEFHNQRPSRGFGMDGKSPLQLYTELCALKAPRKADVHQIAFVFMEGYMVKVRKTSEIEFKKDMFFRADELWNHRGEHVHIRFNPVKGSWWMRADKMQAVFLPLVLFVFDENGQFICEATQKVRMHPTEAEISEPMARQRKTFSDAKKNVKMLTQGNSTQNAFPVVDVKNMPEEAMRQMLDEQKMQKEEEAKKEEERRSNSPILNLLIV